MTRVFIDGSSGTTGLRIHDRLCDRKDIELIHIADAVRKDIDAKKKAYAESDLVFLCLPDAASKEAVEMIPDDVIVIDTSTAFRTSDGWTYGFPEIQGQKDKISESRRIANPGCHAIGFISLIRPLVDKGIIPKDAQLSCYSLTGYSGGGKKTIEQYQQSNDALLKAPRIYGLSQMHKHLPEMKKISYLEKEPLFSPIISDFYSGMEVAVQMSSDDINGSIDDIRRVYSEYYTGKIVRYKESSDEDGFMSALALSGRDDMLITVTGNDQRIMLVSRFDNLGKGASGSAIQNMNIVLGFDETSGLNIKGDEI